MITGQGWIVAGGTIVDLLAAIVIVYHVLWALLGIVQLGGSDQARIRIAQGVLTALGFSVAGSLLKIIGLQTWSQIRMFAFVFALRTMLKRVFAWEQVRIATRASLHSHTSCHRNEERLLSLNIAFSVPMAPLAGPFRERFR